jgi:hypothetical protein
MTMPRSLLSELLDGPFVLTPRPEPVPGDLRIGWGMALVVLLLGASRGKRASLQKLHFLAHSIRTRHTRLQVQALFAKQLRPLDLVIRVEPWLNRALALAKGARLIQMENGKAARLTNRGLQLLKALYDDHAVFIEEKQFLQGVAVTATERAVEQIMRMDLSL